MSSNLKVNTILPSTGSNVAIGTAGGTVTMVGNVDIDINSGISTFNGIHIKSGDFILNQQRSDTHASLIIDKPDAGTGTLKFFNNGSASAYIQHTNSEHLNYYLPSGSGSQVFYTNGTEKLRIDSSGRVLIGLLDGSQANASIDDLQVGNPNASTQTGITIGSNDEGAIAFANTGDARAGSITYNMGTDSMIFKTNGQNERLRIDSSGRVMIGNTDAGSLYASGNNLVVGSGGASNQGITIYTGNAQQGILAFADGTSGGAQQYAGYMIYDHNTNNMLFATQATERLRITSNGTVTKPQQPYVRIQGLTNQTGSGDATDGTATTYGDISYSAGKVTAQVEGNYLITFASISDNGTGRLDARIKVNGNIIVQLLTSANGTGYRQRSGSIVYHLNVNDYVEWNNEDWYSSSNTSSTWRTASVYMLG